MNLTSNRRWGCNMHKLIPLSFSLLLLAGCLPETEVTDNSEPTVPTVPESMDIAVVPYFDYGIVVNAQVYLDTNNDNLADPSELYGSTDVSGVFISDSFTDDVRSNETVSVMVKLTKGVTLIKSKFDSDYYMPETKWLSYDLEALKSLQLARSTSTEQKIHVNSISTWVQALMNGNDQLSITEAKKQVDETMTYVGDIDLANPNYDEYYFKSYVKGLEVGSLTKGDFCCVTVYVPEFTIVGTKIGWSYDEIIQRGGEPDPYVPPTFEYTPEGDMVIVIPDSTDPSDPGYAEYKGNYPAEGEFILPNGKIPTHKTSKLTFGDRDNSSSEFAYTVLNDKLAVAYTRLRDGIPSVSELNIDFAGGSISESSHYPLPSAGTLEVCNESERGQSCSSQSTFPGKSRSIKAFNGYDGEALLSVSGPTTGFYTFKGGSWSSWEDTKAVVVWEECKLKLGEYHCIPHKSYHNYVDTLWNGETYGPSGFQDYLQYGNVTDDKLTYRSAIRYQVGKNVEVGKEGDFQLLMSMPVNLMNTFRVRGNTSAALMGWFNERDDKVRGLAWKESGAWTAVGSTDYDKINAMFSADFLKPKMSGTTYSSNGGAKNQGSAIIIGAIDLEPKYNLQLQVEGWALSMRKYDTEDGFWTSSWLKFEANQMPTSMDVTAFSDKSTVGAFCNSNGKMSLMRWSTGNTVPGIGYLDRHDTEELCTDLDFIEASTFDGGEESVILKNGSTIYGISSDGGYIKLIDNNPIQGVLKFFSSKDGWVLTGSNKTVLVFSNNGSPEEVEVE